MTQLTAELANQPVMNDHVEFQCGSMELSKSAIPHSLQVRGFAAREVLVREPLASRLSFSGA